MGKKKSKKKKKKSRIKISGYLIYAGMAAFIAVFAFLSYFGQLEETSTQKFEGGLSFYEFIPSSSKWSPRYSLTFNSQEFWISKVIIGAFDKDRFIQEVRQGDQLTITYEDENSILQIEKNGTQYMNSEEVNELRSENTILALIFGIVCSLLCIFYLMKHFGFLSN